jgi:hypothetical protein
MHGTCAALCALGVLLLAPSSAYGDDGERRDPVIGGVLAVGGTLLGPALFVAGPRVDSDTLAAVCFVGGVTSMVIGPSAGHFYAGDTRTGVATVIGTTVYDVVDAPRAASMIGTSCTWRRSSRPKTATPPPG